MRISDWSSDVCSSDLRSDRGFDQLNAIVGDMIGAGNQDPNVTRVHTKNEGGAPRIYADIDRAKSDMFGVPPSRVFEALQVYLGSAYVNDFNLLGRTYRVTAQADAKFRDDPSDRSEVHT